MGQQLVGQYPIHFHLAGDVDEKGGYNPPTYVKDLSIHHTFSRCVTVHGSNGLLVSTSFPGKPGIQSPFTLSSLPCMPVCSLLGPGTISNGSMLRSSHLVQGHWGLSSDFRTVSIENRSLIKEEGENRGVSLPKAPGYRDG